MTKTHHRTWLWMLPLLLLICWVGARMLTADILFVDEYWSIRNSGGDPFPLYSLGAVWERTVTLDPGGMGVLYHWLLHIWGRLVGWSVYSVRVFSLFAGVLSVALLYRVGRDMFSARIGLYAAGALAASAFFIDYLHEARAYTLMIFFTLLVIYSYDRVMHRNGSIIWFAALSLSLAALVYTHYVALAIGAVLGVYHLLNLSMTRRWWFIVLAMAIGGALYLPWVGVTLEVIQRGTTDAGRQASAMNAVEIMRELLTTASNMNPALFGLFMLYAVVYAVQKRSRPLLLTILWLGVTLTLVIIVNWRIPFMVHLRYLLLVFPAIALLIGVGIDYLSTRKLPAWLLLGVWIAGGAYLLTTPDFIDSRFGQLYRAPAHEFHAARDLLLERGQPDDMAVFHIIPPGFEPFNYFVLGYYMDATPFRYDQMERMNNTFAASDNDYLPDVRAALGDSEAIWTIVLPQLAQTQRSTVVDYVLRTQYLQCGSLLPTEQGVEMALHMQPPSDSASPAAAFTTSDETTIRVYPTQRDGQRASRLDVPLMLDTDTVPLPNTYSLGVYLLDEAGNAVTQDDIGLTMDTPNACVMASLPLDRVTAGEYTLATVVYNWRSGDRFGDITPLRSITVE